MSSLATGLVLASAAVSHVGAPADDPSASPHGPIALLEQALGRDQRGRVDGRVTIGHSSEGRPIHALAIDGMGDRRVLVFGCIHGTECAGSAVVSRLLTGCPPLSDVAFVRNLNPDGLAAGTRLNGRGVDLNRNFSSDWEPIGARWDSQYSGPRPFSEPETRLARRLIRRLDPDVTIWFHQESSAYVRAWGPSVPEARRYATLADLPFRPLPWLAGTAPNWQNHRFPGTSSFVVEFAPGSLSDDDRGAQAAAIINIGERPGT
jgi:protein MpaA